MKRTVQIPESRLTAPIDFSAMLSTRKACDIALSYTEYGFMQFSSSKLVLFDAYSPAHRYKPFDRDFGVVAFPFYMGVMTDGGERVAYAGLRFGEEEIAEWRLCLFGKRDDIMTRLGTYEDAASVPLASGVCCISDEEGYAKYIEHIKDEIHPLSGFIVLNGQTHSAIKLYGKDYAVFSTGWGDGSYPSYVGLTKDGRIMRLLVDFCMIEYPKRKDNKTLPITIETADAYVYDPKKSEAENHIARWTLALENAFTPVEKLQAYSRRGYAYHSINDTENALKDYEAAADECTRVTDRGALLRAWSVYDNAAGLYVQKNNYAAAIKLMNAALNIHDHFYVGAYFRLIDLYMVTKENEKAVEIAELMIAARPDDPAAIMKYAEVCVSAMEYEKAARVYERLASEFRLYENYFDEVSCLIELSDYDGAAAALERYPAKEYNEQYWYYRAYIDFKKRRYKTALAAAEKSHALDPEYMPALYLLIDIESVTQEYLEVARYAEEYKKLRPDKEYGYSVCAEAQLILGNFSECSRNYYHLYTKVKDSDKYAALAAITAARIGESRRKSLLLRKLHRKRSDYYSGAIYAIYMKEHQHRDASLSKIVYKFRADDDFLLQLAVFFTATGNIASASHLLRALSRGGAPGFEVVAQQIRMADRLGDRKLFDSFFDYYVQMFFDEEVTEEDRKKLADKFRSDKHFPHIPDQVRLPGRTVVTESPSSRTAPPGGDGDGGTEE